MQHSIPYRRDIDGLRALAVLSVLFYHTRIPGFGGGFAGVDVFFVISGFLIGGHIGDEIGTGRFSLVAFYERRIRRIFPALFCMYAVVLLAAAVILFPPDFLRFTGLGIFTISFLANFEIYKTLGSYAGEFARSSPLLHTWSLAVEEQFYLAFPLIMLAIARFAGKRYWLVLAPIALLSLLACVLAARIAPLATFYLAPFRAWELLMGALLALGSFPAPENSHHRSILVLLGIALIAASDIFLSDTTPFPSEYALLPCVGAALIIYARCDSTHIVGRILDNPVAVRIGLWSYSLYLFHWPLLVLAQYYAFEPLSFFAHCLILAASFVLAALSWRSVEQPFRGRTKLFTRNQLYLSAIAAGIVLLSVTIASPWILANAHNNTARARGLFPVYAGAQNTCWNVSAPNVGRKPSCVLGDRTAPVQAILWGDSHSRALLPAVDSMFTAHKQAALFAGLGGCPPLVDVQFRYFRSITSPALLAILNAIGLKQRDECTRHNAAVLRWMAQHQITTAILVGHWIAYVDTRAIPSAVAAHMVFVDTRVPDDGSPPNGAIVFERSFGRTLAILNQLHTRVFVVDDVPLVGVNVPYALASADRLNMHRDFRITRAAYDSQQQIVARMFDRLQKQYGFEILRPQDLLCAGGKCAVSRDGRSLYIDDEHLSPSGAMTVRTIFEPIWPHD